MENNMVSREELYHHGVKGMKWGVRKKRNSAGSDGGSGNKKYTTWDDVKNAKKEMRRAAKDYNKSYNKAYNRAIAAWSPSKKQRAANDARWEDAFDKGSKYCEAKKTYKLMKKSYKQGIKEESKRILEGESFANRMFDRITDAHKYQAELNINLGIAGDKKNKGRYSSDVEIDPIGRERERNKRQYISTLDANSVNRAKERVKKNTERI